jgi:hypothetical protein
VYKEIGVTCRSCGATIAEKAIVCYKCGTPTMETPARVTRSATKGKGGRILVWVVLALVIAAAILSKILWL